MLSRSYRLSIQQHANLATEKIKKDPHPVTVRHAVINSETIVKCAFQNADLVTGLKLLPMIELNEIPMSPRNS